MGTGPPSCPTASPAAKFTTWARTMKNDFQTCQFSSDFMKKYVNKLMTCSLETIFFWWKLMPIKSAAKLCWLGTSEAHGISRPSRCPPVTISGCSGQWIICPTCSRWHWTLRGKHGKQPEIWDASSMFMVIITCQFKLPFSIILDFGVSPLPFFGRNWCGGKLRQGTNRDSLGFQGRWKVMTAFFGALAIWVCL